MMEAIRQLVEAAIAEGLSLDDFRTQLDALKQGYGQHSKAMSRLALAIRVLALVEETLGDEAPVEGGEALLIAIHALTDASYRSVLLSGRG